MKSEGSSKSDGYYIEFERESDEVSESERFYVDI